jgi:hypothetical protein
MNRWDNEFGQNKTLREVFAKTEILRKPISGIVSGYHELPYILIAPRDENPALTIEVKGKINVSPKFIISPYALEATFGEVFDPETFTQELQGRVFSFAYAGNRRLSIENEYFRTENFEEPPADHLHRVNDALMSQENTRTGLIFGPDFRYYPVSVDRYISEIIEREFRA